MGLECTKVAVENKPVKKQSIDRTSTSSVGVYYKMPTIVIRIEGRGQGQGQNRDGGDGQREEKFVNYIKPIDGTWNSVKFSENVGFYQDTLLNKEIERPVEFRISRTENRNYLVNIAGIGERQLWKKIPSEGLWFDQKDQILIGKTTLKLKYFLKPDQTHKMKSRSEIHLSHCKDEKAECRICLQPNLDPENPLVQPCKCIGSVSAIHQRCLSKWIFTNRDSFSEKMAFYKVGVRNWDCQICGSSFKGYIWYRLMSITTYFKGHYAILQIRNQKQQTEKGPSYGICKFTQDQQTLTIGNTETCQFPLCLSPSSSSKQQIHLSLTKTNVGLYLANMSTQTAPYILAQTNYLAYNQEYRLRNMYLMVGK